MNTEQVPYCALGTSLSAPTGEMEPCEGRVTETEAAESILQRQQGYRQTPT
jgi:hypothetical protein